MKKINQIILQPTLFLCIFCSPITAYCQVQEVSVRAPDNIRIDGKTLEWPNNKLKVFNNSNKIFYTVSNDDNNLYLTMRGTYFYGSAKMVGGGVTFTVSRLVDKKAREKDKNSVAVTFPYLDPEAAHSIYSSINSYSNMVHDTLNRVKDHDSLVKVVNAETTAAIKEIKVSGIKEIEDPLISIYNTTGVKAMGTFNRGMAFTLEIAIPLKYLGLAANDDAKFSYNIKLNEPRWLSANGNNAAPMPMVGDMVNGQVLTSAPSVNPDYYFLSNTTDFWGEYTLAKKP
jgi:hypothetical protein